MAVCMLVALSACYRPVVAPALPAPVWLEASRGFRVTESVPNGPDRVCVTTKLSGTVDRISADTIFLGRISELNARAKRQGCVLGVPGYVVADAKAGIRARTAVASPEGVVALVIGAFAVVTMLGLCIILSPG